MFLIDYLWVFIVGGVLCMIAQIIMDATRLVSGQILVIYIVAGVVLTAIGLYDPLVELGKCGATVPLTGFGYSLVNGTIKAVQQDGFIGIFTGGLTATSAGITAAMVFGFVFAYLGRAKTKF